MGNELARQVFASGTGSRGQIGAITLSGANTSVSITLSDANQVVQFEVGQLLVATATDGGAPSTDTVQVTSVDRTNGIVGGVSSVNPSNTLSGNWAALSYLVVSGDIPSAGASGTGSFLAISGFAAWLPTVAPAGGDSFWSVNRSVDTTRLAGVRYNGQSLTIEEALVNGSSLVAREGGHPDMCFMNFTSYSALENALGSKVVYVDVKHDEADIAFAGICVNAPYGRITVVADRNCPSQTCYLLQMNTWKLRSLGKAPHILSYGLEGLEGVRVGNADALEIRIGCYSNLICRAPGWNAVIQLSQ